MTAWTSEPPREGAWYWVQLRHEREPRVCFVRVPDCWMDGDKRSVHPIPSAEVLAAMHEGIEALKEVVPPGDDWWCPTCKEALDGSRVTFYERCDTCGTYLGGVADPKWLVKARAALRALEEARRAT